MNVLVACEESQIVCSAFRHKGHNAFSCDLQDCSGGHPEWHIKGNVLDILNPTFFESDLSFGIGFTTMDYTGHFIPGKWDLIIAHPPCIFLTTAATQCHSLKVYSAAQIADRTIKRISAMIFFMLFVNADCEKIVIENPQGVMSACYRQPDQYIHPFYFASSVFDDQNYFTKKTGLWLKGVDPLIYSCDLPNPLSFAGVWKNGKRKNWTESHHSSVVRSKTFPGVAKAMADQWG